MKQVIKASGIRLLSLAVAAASGLAVSNAMGQNVVQNPGFETSGGTNVGGVAANWNVFDPNVVIDTSTPHTGSQDLFFNVTGAPEGAYIYQDTPAGSVTPGTAYTFSFYAEGSLGVSGVAQYAVTFFGSSGPIYTNNTGVQNYNPTSAYTKFPSAPTTLTAPAGATYAELQFWAVTGAVTGADALVHLDDVSLTGPAASTTGASQWNLSAGGQWETGSNWTNGSPNGVGAEADLFSSTTGTNGITSTHSVNADTAITLGTLDFNNTNTYVVGGAGSLTMQASSGSASIIVQAGTQKISLPLIIASNTVFNVSSGTTLHIADQMEIKPGLSVTTIGGGSVTDTSTIQVDTGSSFAFAGSVNANALTLQASAAASVGGGARHLLQFGSLSLGSGSSLDLSSNDLIVHGGSLSTVTTAIQSGFNGGAWNGAGIQSSAAAADSTHLTALGSMAASAAGTYDGAAVAAGDVIVRYTYYGDALLTGSVTSADYAATDNGYLSHLTGWQNGDFNYDGAVNGSDYTLIDNAFNTQGSPIGSASAQFATATAQIAGATSAVPEPGVISLLGVAGLGLLARRRRA